MKLPDLKRPFPPLSLTHLGSEDLFVPAPEVADWALDVFLFDGSLLYNPHHAHLQMATIGVLWTNEENDRQMRPVVGTAELTKPKPMMSKWEKSRHRAQLRGWFPNEDEPGNIPDFLITLYAPYANRIDNPTFCALVEHELYHCALKHITTKGVPVWGIRGHDVEEFVGIVARYGVGAAAGDTVKLVEAARAKPTIAPAHIEGVCGTCLRLAA
jgi:hypothetical protein